MAKSDGNAEAVDIKAFLQSLPPTQAVYDANDFCNRPFRLERIEWRTFEPSERNNYSSNAKCMMFGTTLSGGKPVLVETTQKGVVNIIAAIEENGYFPCNIQIIKEGKYCTIVAV